MTWYNVVLSCVVLFITIFILNYATDSRKTRLVNNLKQFLKEKKWNIHIANVEASTVVFCFYGMSDIAIKSVYYT